MFVKCENDIRFFSMRDLNESQVTPYTCIDFQIKNGKHMLLLNTKTVIIGVIKIALNSIGNSKHCQQMTQKQHFTIRLNYGFMVKGQNKTQPCKAPWKYQNNRIQIKIKLQRQHLQ